MADVCASSSAARQGEGAEGAAKAAVLRRLSGLYRTLLPRMEARLAVDALVTFSTMRHNPGDDAEGLMVGAGVHRCGWAVGG